MSDETPRQPDGAVRVACHAGHRAEEEPRRLYLGEREIAVVEILDRWLDPEHRYFKVRGDDDGIYILRHEVSADSWDMILFDSGRHDDSRLSST